jgi:hypothetical protein
VRLRAALPGQVPNVFPLVHDVSEQQADQTRGDRHRGGARAVAQTADLLRLRRLDRVQQLPHHGGVALQRVPAGMGE